MMAFRIAWFKVHRPLAFYAAYFSIRAKALDATCMCRGMEVCRQKMKEIEAKDKEAAAVEEDMMVTLEVCYEFYLRGFQFEDIDLYRSDATKFLMDGEKGTLLPPFTAIPGWAGPSSPRRSCWPPAPRSPKPTWSSSGTPAPWAPCRRPVR